MSRINDAWNELPAAAGMGSSWTSVTEMDSKTVTDSSCYEAACSAKGQAIYQERVKKVDGTLLELPSVAKMIRCIAV
jgi:hypothetical protein